MVAQFFAMFAQFFLMLTNLFTAGTKLSNAAVSTASYVEGAAEGFNEKTSLERQDVMDSMRAQYAIKSRIRKAEDAISVKQLENQLAALEAGVPEAK
jgi:hypothetical protein